MKYAIESFDKFSVLEKSGDLKKLVGKKGDEEITVPDAKKIGTKIANMDGLKKKKFVGILNFMGASCDIYNAAWNNYTRTRDSKKDD